MAEPMKTTNEIIDETIAMINVHGRCMENGDSGTCMYRKGNHPGCAVGRCIIPEKYDSEIEFNDLSDVCDIMGLELDEFLIEDYRGHSMSFWSALQTLHDRPNFWDEDNKLTKDGEKFVKLIKEKYED